MQLLVGRPLEELYPQRAEEVGRPLLHLQDARFRPDRRERRMAGAKRCLARRSRGRDRRARRHHGCWAHRTTQRALRHRLAGRWEGTLRDRRQARSAELDQSRAASRCRLRHRRPARQRSHASHGGRPQSRHVGYPSHLALRPDVGGARSGSGEAIVQPVRHPAAESGYRRRRAFRRQSAESGASQGDPW